MPQDDYDDDPLSVPSSPKFSKANPIDDAMEIFDEMWSFDDSPGLPSSPGRPSPSRGARSRGAATTNTDDDDDAATAGSFSPDSGPLSWRLTNSVHMELQENARVPTFALSVDRTGSSFPTAPRSALFFPLSSPPEARRPLPQPLEDEAGAISLGETFLGGRDRDRHSYHSTYAHAGALRHHGGPGRFVAPAPLAAGTGSSVSGDPAPPLAYARSAGSGNGRMSSRQRTDSIEQLFDYHVMDSMPLEDEKKDSFSSMPLGDRLEAQTEPPAFLMDVKVDPTPLEEIRNRHLSHHLGQRPVPLPIPVTTTATSIAAAVAATMVAAEEAPLLPYLHQHPRLRNPAQAGIPMDPPPSTGLAPSGLLERQEAAIGATGSRVQSLGSGPASILSAAIARASQQKSQYGFGRRHRVPSVPEPHAPRRAAKGGASTMAGPFALATGNDNDDGEDGRASGSDNGQNTAEDAYERKKHRAKVARVKLNESIEQLSIAIHVAGSQSKERAAQWRGFLRPGPAPSHGARGTPAVPPPACLTEASALAERAKKWDRPAFVGSAAKMIEYLNSQCDFLMREVIAARRDVDDELCSDHDGFKRKVEDSEDVQVENMQMKRQRNQGREDEMDGVTVCSVCDGMGGLLSGNARVCSCVASFLDPVSLARCTQVSKSFKLLFSRTKVWDDMSIQRFGFFNVRQWREKLEDVEEGVSCWPLRLYKSMDAENVMPHFNHDGMFLLGEARLQGVVSAWTFLVERSNGETLRSCKRQDSQSTFTSLPIVELRTVIQNTGRSVDAIQIREQTLSVDASTRRRGLEMKEITWDDRFQKRIMNLDGNVRVPVASLKDVPGNIICRLKLFESAVIQTFIHAQGCSTTSKFVQRSNFTKIVIQIRDGTTVPLVIPFPRDHSHNLEH